MSERTLLTFTCGECGRTGFTVVDRNPPIPLEVVSIYDKDNEGEDCTECKTCGTSFPEFALYKPPKPSYDENDMLAWQLNRLNQEWAEARSDDRRRALMGDAVELLRKARDNRDEAVLAAQNKLRDLIVGNMQEGL